MTHPQGLNPKQKNRKLHFGHPGGSGRRVPDGKKELKQEGIVDAMLL